MVSSKKDIKKIQKDLEDIKTDLHNYDEPAYDPKIIELWQYVKERAAKHQLEKMPIDSIKDFEKGMPLSQLENAGFKNIYVISNYTPEQFLQIKGVGEKSAYLLKEAVEKVKQSVHIRAKGRIDPDKLERLDFDLLRTIYLKRKLVVDAEKVENQIEAFEQEFKQDFSVIEKQKNIFMKLFQNAQEKEEVNAAIEAVNQKGVEQKFTDIKSAYSAIKEFEVTDDTLKQDFIDNSIQYYTAIENITGYTNQKQADDIPSELVEAVNNVELNVDGLDLTLRNYQEFGAKYALYNKRILLGDEMGLGKTVQALAVINHLNLNNQPYTIVVCPLSVVANWKRETEKFTKLNAFIYHGNGREKVFQEWLDKKGILITTFEHTRNFDKSLIKELNMLVVDEAHFVKNPEAKRSKSIYALSELASHVLYMSGTPLENKLAEMKQLLGVLQPDIANKISKELHLLDPQKFKIEISPVYLRRNRADVLGELPDLEIIEQWSNFGEKEEEIYDQAVSEGQMMAMRRAAWKGGTPEASPKLDALVDICDSAKENGHKVLVFSFFRDVIETVQEHVTEAKFPAITGDVPNDERQKIIDEFTSAEAGAVMTAQIIAGGVGLNIQAANIIILCEPQWKPSTEEQAIGRAYRMGQTRGVVVYRLLTEDSIDVSMLELLGEKSKLFDMYARDSEVADIAQRQMNAEALLKSEEESEASMTKQVMEMEKKRLAEKQAG
ncbi:DEAD/DEAH box helicase [Jeotgalicoccus sp. ATCC 8456]|uniref:DEAD/DEAH box helicase n=1 Tax=Jeotgalicoccus sp. ATCC 8456 TaxID=946435 RepID=UPI0018E62F8F|nr:DEAD/DEAH box helicase [Jeotgalicoccus sp. ATCC 8456]QQD84618.1 DEAD/DEAH box helicase [Jeotgalicoccus sp. ATCC 8456]